MREVAVDHVGFCQVDFESNGGRVVACLLPAVNLPDLVEILVLLLFLGKVVHSVGRVLIALGCRAQRGAFRQPFAARGVRSCGLVLTRLELGLQLRQLVVRGLVWHPFFEFFFRPGHVSQLRLAKHTRSRRRLVLGLSLVQGLLLRKDTRIALLVGLHEVTGSLRRAWLRELPGQEALPNFSSSFPLSMWKDTASRYQAGRHLVQALGLVNWRLIWS